MALSEDNEAMMWSGWQGHWRHIRLEASWKEAKEGESSRGRSLKVVLGLSSGGTVKARAKWVAVATVAKQASASQEGQVHEVHSVT